MQSEAGHRIVVLIAAAVLGISVAPRPAAAYGLSSTPIPRDLS